MDPGNFQQVVYHRRFAGLEQTRAGVWRTLARHYLDRWIKPQDSVLDLGAGYCEFINVVAAAQRFALDSNPETLKRAARGVTVLIQEATQPWPIPDESVDVVFTSNFFEHLPTKQAVSLCLREAYRVLRGTGLLIALGPNIRYCPDVYWDFLDHHLPLSDHSVVEGLEISGFQIEQVLPRFLPFSMSNGFPYRPFMVRAYLALPILQQIWGKQFLVVARKPNS